MKKKKQKLIASDPPRLGEAQAAAAGALLDLIIPPSDDGRMPGASSFDVLGYLHESRPELVPAIGEALAYLDRQAQALHDSPFTRLPGEVQAALVSDVRRAQPEFLLPLAQVTATVYYQQDRVLEAIGMEPRPPFPEGYEVQAGDLGLLDPVRRRGRVYKEV